MIFNAIHTLSQNLDEYLMLKFNNPNNFLEISNLLNQDGSPAYNDSNKIIMSLINIEEDSALRNMNNPSKNQSANNRISQAPINLNMYIVFTSVFSGKNYTEGLKILSALLEYLQENPIITHLNTPQLNKYIEKISIEFVNLDMQTLNNLWATIGGKYMPSVLYKLRIISRNQDQIKDEIPKIQGLENEVSS